MKNIVPTLLILACNAPPEGGALTIEPTSPTTSDDLRAVISSPAADPNKKDDVSYTYVWERNGEVVADLTTDTVPASATSKGQTWKATATPTDGKEPGTAFSAETVIQNTAPELQDVAITPTTATRGTDLSVTYRGIDLDEDVVEVAISWRANGTEVATGKTLSGSALRKGDAVRVVVTPNDGETDGEPVEAGPVVVANTPPSAPGVAIEPGDGNPNADLVCVEKVASTDRDDDTLVGTVTWTLNGAPYTGALSTTRIADDTVPKSVLARDQVWTCMMTIDDGEVAVSSAASAPVTIVLPDSVTFQAGYYWVVADYAAPLADHEKVCAAAGLRPTDGRVNLTWEVALLEKIAADLGYTSAGDTNCCASSMWCWDGGDSPFQPGAKDGSCETHNPGASYENYGAYSGSMAERPVFTCQ